MKQLFIFEAKRNKLIKKVPYYINNINKKQFLYRRLVNIIKEKTRKYCITNLHYCVSFVIIKTCATICGPKCKKSSQKVFSKLSDL